MNKPLDKFWVIVDKRGTILERGAMRKASVKNGAELPMFTLWGNRVSARHEIKKIKSQMGKEAWESWKFYPKQYKSLN
jgi:hypothetical protein